MSVPVRRVNDATYSPIASPKRSSPSPSASSSPSRSGTPSSSTPDSSRSEKGWGGDDGGREDGGADDAGGESRRATGEEEGRAAPSGRGDCERERFCADDGALDCDGELRRRSAETDHVSGGTKSEAIGFALISYEIDSAWRRPSTRARLVGPTPRSSRAPSRCSSSTGSSPSPSASPRLQARSTTTGTATTR